MERKVKGNAVVLKQETKDDIQELFNELFVGELSEKIADVSEQTTGNLDTLESIKKQTVQNSNVICDKIDELQKALCCLGTVDDWGEDNLTKFLNQLAELISDCKEKEKKQLNILGTEWEKTNVYDSLKGIEAQILETINIVKQTEQQTIKPEFEKLFNEIKQIANIIRILEKVEENFDFVKREFEEEGAIWELNKKQEEIVGDIVTYKITIEEIKNKLNLLSDLIERSFSLISEIQEIYKSGTSTMCETIKQNRDNFNKKFENYEIQGKRRYVCMTCGVGFLAFMNIVMFIMLLMK